MPCDSGDTQLEAQLSSQMLEEPSITPYREQAPLPGARTSLSCLISSIILSTS